MASGDISDQKPNVDADADSAAISASAKAMAREYAEAATKDPRRIQEWIGEKNLTYGGLIAIGMIIVQPFLAAASLDLSAMICVVAFAVAIPLLAALILLNRQEAFRHQFAHSGLVSVGIAVAQLSAFVGVVAGFWHIHWIAGAAVIASSVLAMGVHSAGFMSVEPDAGLLRGARNRSDDS